MGKSTLARYIRQAIEHTQQQQQHNGGGGAQQASELFPQISFSKISYDGILGDNIRQYERVHPETPFHEIIDIIRGQADRDYLEQIQMHCYQSADPKLAAVNDPENAQPAILGKQRVSAPPSLRQK